MINNLVVNLFKTSKTFNFVYKISILRIAYQKLSIYKKYWLNINIKNFIDKIIKVLLTRVILSHLSVHHVYHIL